MAMWSGAGPELHVFEAEVLLLSQPEGPRFQGQKKVVFIVEKKFPPLSFSHGRVCTFTIAIMWAR